MNDDHIIPEQIQPLATEFLIQNGTCCGSGCLNCPYKPAHTKGASTIVDKQNDSGT